MLEFPTKSEVLVGVGGMLGIPAKKVYYATRPSSFIIRLTWYQFGSLPRLLTTLYDAL